MIAKLIVWGKNHPEAIERMKRALYEYVITGPKNNIPFHKAVMENPRFVKGHLGTHFIEHETTLLDDMRALMEREIPLETRLPRGVSLDKKRIAAIAAVAAVHPEGLGR